MATPWTPAQRLAAYALEGITRVVEMPGWRLHNRDEETGKTFGPVYGALVHHTAGVGPGVKDLIRSGRSDLPGPLAHDYLAKDGTLYLIGHGRANHAGTTTPAVRDAIIAEQAPLTQRNQGTETVDANDFLYGIEIENAGDGKDPYPAVQYDTAVRWAAAICRHHGWSANSVWGHKEITTRKIDPSFNMTKFRDDVADRLAGAAHVPEPTTTEDDMEPIDVWAYKGKKNPAGTGAETRDAYAYLRDTEGTVKALAARVAQLETTGLTDAQIAKLADVIADRLSARLAN